MSPESGLTSLYKELYTDLSFLLDKNIHEYTRETPYSNQLRDNLNYIDINIYLPIEDAVRGKFPFIS